MSMIELSDFYAGGSKVPSGTEGIPSTGEISISDFYGASSGAGSGASYTSTNYSTAGTTAISIPSNAGNVRVTLWGAGGGGGSSHDLNCPYGNACGCDGADGGVARRTISGIGGTTVYLTIGTGGLGNGGTWYEKGSYGGTTSFGFYASATGGEGGNSSASHTTSCSTSPTDGSGGSYDYPSLVGDHGTGGQKGCACTYPDSDAGDNGYATIEWGSGV